MDEVEAQIARWTDGQVRGVDPVTVEEVLARAQVSATPHPGPAPAPAPTAATSTRRGRWLALAAAAIVLVAGVVAVVRHRPRSEPVQSGTTTSTTRASTPDGWHTYLVRELDMTMDVPDEWASTQWGHPCGAAGALVSNLSPPPAWVGATRACPTGWRSEDLMRPGFVGVEVRRAPDDHALTPSAGQAEAPLALRDLPVVDDDASVPPGVTLRRSDRTIAGDPRRVVEVYLAKDASPADVARAREVVASIRWREPASSGNVLVRATGSPASSTMLACMTDRGHDPRLELRPRVDVDDQPAAELLRPTGPAAPGFDRDLQACWGEGDAAADRFARDFAPWMERPAPSQTPAEAARDHVDPALAQAALHERGAPISWFDAKEGTWAIVRSADGLAAGSGEVVLVDATGRVVRAYPMPGLPPTWIHPTKDAIYAGRVGDGGSPDSAVIRIDRQTRKARALFFPAAVDGGTTPAIPSWGQVDDVAYDDLVHVGIDQVRPGDTLVDSTIGVTAIDLAAVEALFP